MFQVIFEPSSLQNFLQATRFVLHGAGIQNEKMQQRCAIEFRLLLISAIVSQKYAGRYPKYNRDYKKWKQKAVGHLKFWLLFRQLLSSISAYRTTEPRFYAWASGIPGNVYFRAPHPQSKPIGLIAQFHEFGHHPNPERPLFAPLTNEYASGRWSQVGWEHLKNIGRNWM
jgi:hypothetical protein